MSRADIVRVLAEWPDRHWTWARAAGSLCRRLIREHGIRLLYTSAVPISPLSTAAALRRESDGLRWVADFRDPVGYGRKHTAQGQLAAMHEQRIIRRTMDSADMITGLAGSYQGIFFDLYGVPESRYRFIPTGLDEAYLGEAPGKPRPVFIHVGEVMPNQSRHALVVLARAARTRPDLLAGFRLEVVGRREINQPLVEAMLAGIPDWSLPVDFIDHVPQAEVYQRLRTARAALLIPGRGRYWWTNFAKLVDYIALGVPVIADVSAISEAREELTKAGNACFLGGDAVGTDAQSLLDWLARTPPETGATGYARRYTAARQAADFAKVFRQLLEAPGDAA
jgi:glycosyltransferase involved in cell wall biosynthesis